MPHMNMSINQRGTSVKRCARIRASSSWGDVPAKSSSCFPLNAGLYGDDSARNASSTTRSARA